MGGFCRFSHTSKSPLMQSLVLLAITLFRFTNAPARPTVCLLQEKSARSARIDAWGER